MVTAKFISFEGGEGCGKSTQVKLLSAALTERGIEHIVTREPGGTPLAERIRPLLVQNLHSPLGGESKSLGESRSDSVRGQDSATQPPHPNPLPIGERELEDWHPMAETLLFLAARVQHVEQLIKPALAEGKWVLCDRFADSTFVYQGIAKGLGIDVVQQLQQQALGEFMPDKTVLLDIDPEQGLKRAASRADNETRFEQLDIAFHQSLRQGFLQLAEAQAARFNVIDATQSIEQIQQQVLESVL